jgi:hypothetical protein
MGGRCEVLVFKDLMVHLVGSAGPLDDIEFSARETA